MGDLTDATDLEEAPTHLLPEAARAYLDARMQGLCHEGAIEIAEGVQRALRAAAGPPDGNPGGHTR